MSHDLEVDADGTARFAYNQRNGDPWHRLGVPLDGVQDIDTMLRAAGADYEVRLTKVAIVDDANRVVLGVDGEPLIVDEVQATVRVNPDGSAEALATVGSRYEVRQNREIAERAVAVVGASNGDAVIDTCGVLRGGRRFFMTIDLGATFIDPMGVNDKIDRYLVVSKGHDGVWPIRYANTDVRAVCRNTVMLGLTQAQRVFTARHTRNVDVALEDAREVLRLSVEWGQRFEEEAERLLAIPIAPHDLDRFFSLLLPLKKGETDRQKRNRESVQSLIRTIYASDKNAGGFGNNGWSLYNAVVEYLDHWRDAEPEERAIATMEEKSWVNRMKVDAHELLVARFR